MHNTPGYPPSEFRRDYLEWLAASPREPDSVRRAHLLFSRRYYSDLSAYRYRVNRFVCIVNSLGAQLPQLVQDRIAQSRPEMNEVPQALLLALLEWACALSDTEIATLPHPHWPSVLARFDELGNQSR